MLTAKPLHRQTWTGKIAPAAWLLVLLAAFSGVKGSERELNGQIFIRTEDGNTVRLSLTDICVLDRHTASSVLDQMEHLREAKLATVRPAFEKAERELKKFNEEVRPVLSRQEQLLKESEKLTDLTIQKSAEIMQNLSIGDGPAVTALKDERRARAQREFDEVELKFKRTNKEIRLSKDEIRKGWAKGKQLEQTLDSTRRAEKEAQNLSQYASELKGIKVISRTTADVDGKFSIAVPEDAVVFAFSSRNVNGDTESYCWLVTTSPTDQPFMLTNKNTIDTSAPENFAAHQ